MRIDPQICIQPIETPLGILYAAWSPEGLWSLQFSEDYTAELEYPKASRRASEFGKHRDRDRESDEVQENLRRAVEGYFSTGCFQWALADLDWRAVTSYQRLALQACSRIPSGSTATYGEIAKALGNPRAARSVGSAMARNRWPLLIPCHRVLSAGGGLTGYSAAGGIRTKKWLLDFERRQAASTARQPRSAQQLSTAPHEHTTPHEHTAQLQLDPAVG
jgi:methylated-DNA-[protein]-cysteine S-methyltransferase